MENRIQKRFTIYGEDIYKIFLNGNQFPSSEKLTKQIYEFEFDNAVVKCDEEISKEFRLRCTDIKKINVENEYKFVFPKDENDKDENDKDENDKDENKNEEKPNTDLDENKKQVIMKIQDEDSLDEYDSEIKKEKEKNDN